VHCFTGCDWRDIKDQFVRQGLLPAFVPVTLAEWPRPARSSPVAPSASPTFKGFQEPLKIEVALKLWKQSVPLKGTPYFTETRGLDIGDVADFEHCLRWHQGISAVVALMTDPINNQPTGVHRSFLNPDATKRERKMLGKQGVIRLSRDEDVLEGLGLTEGIEDALKILLSGWAPVWAATSAGAVERFPVLSGIDALTIFRDDDDTGIKAAEVCAQRWSAIDREVFIASLRGSP
jgi:hypothetical protein